MSRMVLFYWILAVSLIAFVLFGIDKEKAARRKWRVPEKTLFLFAALGGAPGALLGMLVFRHKTKHPAFTAGIPAILLLWVLLILIALWQGWLIA